MLLLTALVISSGAAQAKDIGDGFVFAPIPATPGFPEAVVVHHKEVFITAPANFGTAGTGPSEIYVLKRKGGALKTTLTVQGENLAEEHALSGAAVDKDGRLYVISTQLGMLRFKKKNNGTWKQTSYSSPFPDLNTADPIPPLPNDATFEKNGTLYVSDSLQGTIWKVAAGGGAPQAWFQSPLLAVTGQAQLGPNGLRVSPDRQWLYIAYSGGPAVAPGELAQPGRIYRLPLVANPQPTDLELVYTYTEFDQPDGIAFDEAGRLFVVLAGTNAISLLNVCGTPSEFTRITGPNGSTIPFANPANIAFVGESVLVTNHAIATPNPHDFFSVLKVYVGVKGASVIKPNL